jgi:hypothetical protein
VCIDVESPFMPTSCKCTSSIRSPRGSCIGKPRWRR